MNKVFKGKVDVSCIKVNSLIKQVITSVTRLTIYSRVQISQFEHLGACKSNHSHSNHEFKSNNDTRLTTGKEKNLTNVQNFPMQISGGMKVGHSSRRK